MGYFLLLFMFKLATCGFTKQPVRIPKHKSCFANILTVLERFQQRIKLYFCCGLYSHLQLCGTRQKRTRCNYTWTINILLKLQNLINSLHKRDMRYGTNNWFERLNIYIYVLEPKFWNIKCTRMLVPRMNANGCNFLVLFLQLACL